MKAAHIEELSDYSLTAKLVMTYNYSAGPEDRATQACDPSAGVGGYTAGEGAVRPPSFLYLHFSPAGSLKKR